MNKSYNGKIESAQSDYAVKTRQEKNCGTFSSVLRRQCDYSDNVTHW